MASRNISISLPEEMIQQASQLAKREHRTLSELFREAFRLYRAQQLKKLVEDTKQSGFKDQELSRIAKQIRAELEAERIDSETEPGIT